MKLSIHLSKSSSKAIYKPQSALSLRSHSSDIAFVNYMRNSYIALICPSSIVRANLITFMTQTVDYKEVSMPWRSLLGSLL